PDRSRPAPADLRDESASGAMRGFRQLQFVTGHSMVASSEKTTQTQDQLERLNSALESGAFVQVRQMLNGLSAPVIAHLMESSPPKVREVLWRLVEKENEGEVINHLNEDIQADLLEKMSPEQVAFITEGLETDDIADILRQLPEKV